MINNIKKTIKPTDEQKEAINLFAEGDNLGIEAFAGAGKTSTLNMFAKYNKGRGQYVAFNKSIVEDAKSKFPKHVRCNTAHSLAFGVKGKDYSDRLFNARRIRSIDVGRFLELKPLVIQTKTGANKILSVSQLGSLVNQTVTRFSQSADHKISYKHIPYVDGLDMPEDGNRTYENNNKVKEYLSPYLDTAWADLQSTVGGALTFKHEHYLKMWQLSDPKIGAEYILFDEAQDASPVMLDIIKNQKNSQLIFVGDSHQRIYSFMGSLNAMQEIPASNRTYLTQSFRFGEAIASKANSILDMLGTDMKVKGLDSIDSYIGSISKPDAFLSRTNSAAIEACIKFQASGMTVALVGGAREIVNFTKGAQDLMSGRKSYHHELSCFDDWSEVVEYVEQDADGSDLKLMVDLIERYGANVIINALGRTVSNENKADIVVSTVHKSKGREWDTVKLASDFPDIDRLNDEEKRLLYVGTTRAKLGLDISDVEVLI